VAVANSATPNRMERNCAEGRQVLIGNLKLMQHEGIALDRLEAEARKLATTARPRYNTLVRAVNQSEAKPGEAFL
jgi:hypothetical protein